MASQSYYELLEVEISATDAEIKRSYRKLAMKYHPDKNPEGAEQFKDISHAYETLSDPDRRAAYDQYGSEGPHRGHPFDGFYDGGDMDGMEDMYANFFGGGGGGGRPRAPQVERHALSVTLEELFRGKKIRMKLTRSVPCKVCKGLGGKKSVLKDCFECSGKGFRMATQQVGPGLLSQMQVKCNGCKGSGKIIPEKSRCRKCKGECVVDENDTVEAVIKPGELNNAQIVLKGKGDQKPGMDPLDLIFVINQKAHGVFTRDNADLTTTAEIDLAEALCGFSRVLLTHLDGRAIEVTHKAGAIRPGDVLFIKGEGMPVAGKSGSRGNLYIKINIKFPAQGWRPDVTALRSLLPETKWPKVTPGAGVETGTVAGVAITTQEFERRVDRDIPESEDEYAYGGHEHAVPECNTQ
ncbi:DnaJ-like protein xdj1 [Kickxella alabastrina]|uniref:DnaJ-like protein xdj1 n=1 Tax=Kickxella alabastrina TaxID=61397 RepID=A0ACC1I9R0_9FUNG|nr:DnaJ-like protein xdj1 [Kickxella alabastrina]